MKNFKEEIKLVLEKALEKMYEQYGVSSELRIDVDEIIEKSSQNVDSDYSIPCFKLAKIFHNSPIKISEELKEIFEKELKENSNIKIEKIELLNGYINIYVDSEEYINEVFTKFNSKGKLFGRKDVPTKTYVIDFSSPNIAKEFHIGHLKTTLIGKMFDRLGSYLGHHTIGDNHLGDYGTQFGKLIEGYNMWKDEYSFKEEPINDLTNIYIRINKLCDDDPKVLEKCRDNFKKLEEGDEELTKIWQKFVDLSLVEFNRYYEALNVDFDYYFGEASYSKDLPGIIEKMEKEGVLKDSQGAKIVEFDDGSEPALIVKSNGSTLYITRDIATAYFRMGTFHYDENLYVVASEQILHFAQLKKVLAKMNAPKKYVDGIHHVPYGMIRLPEGKMSTRKGNVVRVKNLLEEAVKRTKDILSSKENTLTDEEKEKVAKQVGIGAVIFSNLSNQLIKDQVFVWDNVLNFSAGSSPYIQYVIVRINSILKEFGYVKNEKNESFLGKIEIPFTDMETGEEKSFIKEEKFNIFRKREDNIKELVGDIWKNHELFKKEVIINIIKKVYEFPDVLTESLDKKEPYIVTIYLLALSKLFSEYYTKERILTNDPETTKANIYICYLVSSILEVGLNILGIEAPEKM